MKLTQSLELDDFLIEFKEHLEEFSDPQKTALYVELDLMTEFYEEAMSKYHVIQWLKTDVKMDLISDLKEKYPYIEKHAKHNRCTFKEALEYFTRVYSIDDDVVLYQPQPLERRNKMKKYYIEISGKTDYDLGDLHGEAYILQSEFFDTEKEALDWAENIMFITDELCVSLMSAIFDGDDEYSDIEMEREFGVWNYD